MPWCVPIPWPDPTTETLSWSIFGNGYSGNGDGQLPAGQGVDAWVTLQNDRDRLTPYDWSTQNGCICVETSDAASAPLPASIKYDAGGGGVVDFAELSKEEMYPEIQACLDCFEQLFGCSFLDLIPEDEPLTKDAIVAAIQAGLSDPDGPEETSTTATIIGVVPWGGSPIDLTNDGLPTEFDEPVNPSCEGDDFGTLVIDLNLPETVQPGTTAQTTFTVIDAAAGWGTTYVFDKGNNLVLAQTYPPGAGGQGNSTPVPFDHSVSYTIPAGTDPTDVCLVINAWGQGGSWEGSCDEIGPGETIVTVTPDPCGPAKACFEDIFGCTLQEMIEFPAPPEIPEIPEIPEPVLPATTIPIPDNEVDTSIRGAVVGTSLLYSRADHNHAIRRQVHPEWPGMTINDSASITNEIVLDRRSTEEWIEYETRTELNVPAGNNWPILRVPNIAGFQQPIITVVNMYRNQTLTYQEDDQPTGSTVFDGAAPVGPYMGIEASHWSSTRGIYLPFRRQNDITRWWVTVSAKYVRL